MAVEAMKLRWPITRMIRDADHPYPAGRCLRCGRVWTRRWNRNEPHPTYYGERGQRACFPLCERCWSALKILERLPFYRVLVERWAEEDYAVRVDMLAEHDRWDEIKTAVLDGG